MIFDLLFLIRVMDTKKLDVPLFTEGWTYPYGDGQVTKLWRIYEA